MKKLLITSLIATLTACGGGSGGSGGFTGGGDGFDKISGVWDSSYDFGSEGVNEMFLVIDEEGEVVLYNYAGDSYDDWGDCYWITVVDHLNALGNNNYESEIAGELKITVSRNVMTISGVDEDGDEFATDYARSSRSVSSFTPECSDSFADARALIPAKKTKQLPLYKSQ